MSGHAIRIPRLQAWQQARPSPDWQQQKCLWSKLWDRYWEGSHIEFGAIEFAVCAWLMAQANRYGRQEDGSGLAVKASGAPITRADIGKKMGLELHQVDRALQMIGSVGTIEIPAGMVAAVEGDELMGCQNDVKITEKLRKNDVKTTVKTAEKFSHETERELKTTNKRGKIIFHLRDGVYSPSQKTIDRWVSAHPDVDVLGELQRCSSWCIDNPSKRSRAPAGMKRRISNWLGAETEKAKHPHQRRTRPAQPRQSQAQALAALAAAQLSTEEQRPHE